MLLEEFLQVLVVSRLIITSCEESACFLNFFKPIVEITLKCFIIISLEIVEERWFFMVSIHVFPKVIYQSRSLGILVDGLSPALSRLDTEPAAQTIDLIFVWYYNS